MPIHYNMVTLHFYTYAIITELFIKTMIMINYESNQLGILSKRYLIYLIFTMGVPITISSNNECANANNDFINNEIIQ